METFSALLALCVGHLWIPHTKASDAELLLFSLICAWTNDWVNTWDVGDLRHRRAHYDVTVILQEIYGVIIDESVIC